MCDFLLLSSIVVVVSFRSGCRIGVGCSCGVGGACGVGGGGGDNCVRHSVVICRSAFPFAKNSSI